MLELASLMAAVATAAEQVPAAAEKAGISISLDNTGLGVLFGTIACGIIVMGAAKGIGNIVAQSTESVARQPEAGGRIFTMMIIGAALIEGVTLFALIICLLVVLK